MVVNPVEVERHARGLVVDDLFHETLTYPEGLAAYLLAFGPGSEHHRPAVVHDHQAEHVYLPGLGVYFHLGEAGAEGCTGLFEGRHLTDRDHQRHHVAVPQKIADGLALLGIRLKEDAAVGDV